MESTDGKLAVNCGSMASEKAIDTSLAEEAKQLLCGNPGKTCADSDDARHSTVCETDFSEAIYTLELNACTTHCVEAVDLIIKDCLGNGWTSGYVQTEDEYYFLSDKATGPRSCKQEGTVDIDV